MTIFTTCNNSIVKMLCVSIIIVVSMCSCNTVGDNLTTEPPSEMIPESTEALPESPLLSESATVPAETPSTEEVVPPTESTEVPSEGSQEQPVEVLPTEDTTDIEIPEPESPPQKTQSEALEELNEGLEYEDGKITVARYYIDGTADIVDVTDEEAKATILEYCDTMLPSEYDIPPGGGVIIDVIVYRDDVIEHYSFSDELIDNNAFGKNLLDDVSKWYIVNKEAFPFLSNILD